MIASAQSRDIKIRKMPQSAQKQIQKKAPHPYTSSTGQHFESPIKITSFTSQSVIGMSQQARNGQNFTVMGPQDNTTSERRFEPYRTDSPISVSDHSHKLASLDNSMSSSNPIEISVSNLGKPEGDRVPELNEEYFSQMFKQEPSIVQGPRKRSEFDTVSATVNPPRMFKVKKKLISSDLKKKFNSHRKITEEYKSARDEMRQSGKNMSHLESLPKVI